MNELVVSTQQEQQQVDMLLDQKLPSYRQAYSDRAAWLMACMSELAYIRFNPLFSNEQMKKYFLASVEKLVKKARRLRALNKLIDVVAYDPKQEQARLEQQLQSFRLKLACEPISVKDTQAILVSNGEILILAFRGTEPTRLADVKTDLKSNMVKCESGGFVHNGFRDAFHCVQGKIEEALQKDEHAGLPLFITGHSLGGALATIAAKILTHSGGIAACYTYGSPRVGDKEWISTFKVPVYRLVNAADIVTMVPFSGTSTSILEAGARLIPYVGKKVADFLRIRMGRYMHAGDMRYLTNCPPGDFGGVERLFSVQWLYRIKALKDHGWPWKKLATDHAVAVYRQKLQIIAERNNPVS